MGDTYEKKKSAFVIWILKKIFRDIKELSGFKKYVDFQSWFSKFLICFRTELIMALHKIY